MHTVVTFTHENFNLVYFTAPVPDTSNTSATETTQVRQKRHECNTSATRMTRVQDE